MPISRTLHRMIACLPTLALIALAHQPASVHAALIAAAAYYQYANSSYNAGGPTTPISGDTSIYTTVSDVYDSGFQASASLEYRVVSESYQKYGIFGGSASAYMKRLSPYDFEYFQSFATGTFKETLTIPAPLGVANGSTGKLMLGWDITGSHGFDDNSSSYMSISAMSSASLPGSSSYVVGIFGSGHYQLLAPIPFIFGTPFVLTVESGVFAGTGYDYRFTTPPTAFTGYAFASYSNTAVLSTALVSDAVGTPYPEAAIITDSGHAFPVVVPEPTSSVLLLVGAGVLMASRVRKQRRK